MRNGTEALFVVVLLVALVAGGIFIFKNSGIGCIDYFFGKACGVNVTR